jgi:26S proteasome regulatory subunit N2
MATKNQDIY